MDLDLAQFHDTFFDESFEALDSMEGVLLKLDIGAPDSEGINTVFRVAHSIKGGAGMFGFADVASFTHTLETLLDELRAGRMDITAYISDNLLRSVDVLRELMRAVQRKETGDTQRVRDLQSTLDAIVARKLEPQFAGELRIEHEQSPNRAGASANDLPVDTDPAGISAVPSASKPTAPTSIAESPKAVGAEASSIRVNIEKIDELINHGRRAGHHPGHAE